MSDGRQRGLGIYAPARAGLRLRAGGDRTITNSPCSAMHEPALHAAIEALGGYDASSAGDVRVADSAPAPAPVRRDIPKQRRGRFVPTLPTNSSVAV